MAHTLKTEWHKPDSFHENHRIERKSRPAGRLRAIIEAELALNEPTPDAFADAARRDALRTRISEETSDKRLALPNVTSVAFNRHLMAAHGGALRDLTCDCLTVAVEEIRAAHEELELLKEFL